MVVSVGRRCAAWDGPETALLGPFENPRRSVVCVPHVTSEPDIRILQGLPERVGRPQVRSRW